MKLGQSLQNIIAVGHGSITFMSITFKLQLHLILPITITSNYS